MKKRILSFKYAFRGIYDFVKAGTNAKIQLVAAVGIAIVGIALKFTELEWLAVVICIALVLSAECINTALEELANEVCPDKKESIRRIKDMAAGAVLISAIGSLIVGTVIVVGKLL